jgi:preprotein translocase subunit YajC
METILSLIGTLAMASSPQGTEPTAPGIVQFMPFILIIVVFYFILIRPQQKQAKEQQKLVDSLKSGDQVLMSNGIYGTIMDVKDKTLLIKVADNVKIKVLRTAVTQIVSGEKEKVTA